MHESLSASEINILIADDHPVFCKGLVEIVRRQKLVNEIYEAHNGLEVMRLLQKHPVNVVFLDYRMPEMDGLQCLRKIKSLHSNVKVIIVSMIDEAPVILNIINEGADGYVLKNKIGNEIVQAYRSVMNGDSYYDEEVKKVLEKYRNASESLPVLRSDAKLSQREFQILKLVALGKSSKEAADQLHISVETANHHRQNGMHKINAKGIVDVTRYFISNGYIATEEFLNGTNQDQKGKP